MLPKPRPDVLQSGHVNAMHRLLVTLALGAALASIALAQTATTPDLSGTWKLNLAKSKLDKHNTVVSETITITSKDATIEFHYTTDSKDHTETYIADGRERSAGNVKGIEIRATAGWKKSVLTIDRGPVMMGHTPEEAAVSRVTDRWTLSADGRTLKQDSEGFDTRQTFVYDKQ